MDSLPAPVSPPKRHDAPAASELLAELHDAFPNEQVTVEELIERLEGRAIGLLLLILALPMCIPNIPGISTIFGVLLVAPAVQMIFGGRSLWLPKRVRRWSFPREGLQRAIVATTPYLKRIERYISPRWTIFTRAPLTVFFGVQTLLMAFVLVLPIPGGNWPPGMTVAITALALLQRDGVLMLLSTPVAAASVAVAYVGVRIGWAMLNELGQIMHGWGEALVHWLR